MFTTSFWLKLIGGMTMYGAGYFAASTDGEGALLLLLLILVVGWGFIDTAMVKFAREQR